MTGSAVAAGPNLGPALAQRHPITIAVCCLSFGIAAFATVDIVAYLIMIGILAFVIVAGKVPTNNIVKIVGVGIPLCFFITIIQAVTQGGPDIANFMIGSYAVHLSRAGVILGIAITFRVIILGDHNDNFLRFGESDEADSRTI